MKINKQFLILGIITFCLIGIIVFIIIEVIPQTYEKQFFYFCIINNWEKNLSFSGELSGTINCIDFWNENFKGQWQDKCSTWIWSDKISCHDLCNVDCEFYNKQKGENMCVC